MRPQKAGKKGRIMKKKILSVIMILALTAGTCSVAAAADKSGATRSGLQSRGVIEYHKGNDEVVINSEDLYMLADRIDLAKQGVAGQLEAINTYFTAGDGVSLATDRQISVTHTQPSKADSVDPMSVNFDTLLEGIAASQSVSSDVTAYGYSSGTALYKGENGELTTDGAVKGAEQIRIGAATADNLSAGTAAWVNGHLILGTGKDNKAYFESGYSSGEENKAQTPSGGLGTGGEENTIRAGKEYTFTEDMDTCYLYLANDSNSNYVGAPAVNLISGQVIMTRIVRHRMDSISGNGSAHISIYRLTNAKKGSTIKFTATYGGILFK